MSLGGFKYTKLGRKIASLSLFSQILLIFQILNNIHMKLNYWISGLFVCLNVLTCLHVAWTEAQIALLAEDSTSLTAFVQTSKQK